MSDNDERVDDKNPTPGVHEPGTASGNELAGGAGREPGREAEGEAGSDRPAGRRTARDSTGINPDKEGARAGDSEIPPA
jgi:hypothetical protein